MQHTLLYSYFYCSTRSEYFLFDGVFVTLDVPCCSKQISCWCRLACPSKPPAHLCDSISGVTECFKPHLPHESKNPCRESEKLSKRKNKKIDLHLVKMNLNKSDTPILTKHSCSSAERSSFIISQKGLSSWRGHGGEYGARRTSAEAAA